MSYFTNSDFEYYDNIIKDKLLFKHNEYVFYLLDYIPDTDNTIEFCLSEINNRAIYRMIVELHDYHAYTRETVLSLYVHDAIQDIVTLFSQNS